VDGAGALRIVISDISERKISEAKIEALAFFDSLTQLPNRTLLFDRVQQAMTNSHRYGTFAALLFVDLDQFKSLNDSQGHAAGDQWLRTVAQAITASIRASDTVARLGGDEFVVLLVNLIGDRQAAVAEAAMVSEKIRATVEQAREPGELEHGCSASIGVSLFRGHESSMEDLFKQADRAMYEAKQAGRNRVCFFASAG
jgi:diguanylate cyclase (GGDEF)-like protein